jgi:hypothetical protein
MGVFKLDDETLKERLWEGLVNMYSLGYKSTAPAVVIAALCENYLDRSGELLGKVRKASAEVGK